MSTLDRLKNNFDLASYATLAIQIRASNPEANSFLVDLGNAVYAASGLIEKDVEYKTGLEGDTLASIQENLRGNLATRIKDSRLLPDSIKWNDKFVSAVQGIATYVLDQHIKDGEFYGDAHHVRQYVAALAQVEAADQLGLAQPEYS